MNKIVYPSRFLLGFLFMVTNSIIAAMPVFIGTQTRDGNGGIYYVTIDTDTGNLSEPIRVSAVSAPTFLAWSPDGEYLYSVNEVKKFAGEEGGGVTAFSYDAENGGLTPVNSLNIGSPGPCHLALDATGKLLVTANYGGASVSVLGVGDGGILEQLKEVFPHEGSGQHEQRQKRPHPHGVTFSPDNRFVLIPDLGTDRVEIYKVSNDGLVRQNAPGILHPGAGPRHASFSPDGRHVYVVNELDNTLSLFDWDAHDGTLAFKSTLSILPEGFEAMGTAAEVCVDPTGRFIYASSRGHDLIVLFQRNAESGELTMTGHYPSGGGGPRSFALSSDGRWMLVANQQGNNLKLFEVDTNNGQLTPRGEPRALPLPVCVVFVPLGKN